MLFFDAQAAPIKQTEGQEIIFVKKEWL